MFQVPEKDLPECLKDEQRLNVLFAPLRSRSVNPKDWDSKICSWKEIIKVYCLANNVYSFTLSELNNVFIRNGRPPSCLGEVLQDFVRCGEVQEYEIFLRKSSKSWSGWATEIIIRRPFSWSVNKLNSMLSSKERNISYVHLEVIENKSKYLLECIPENSKNKLINLKELSSIFVKDIQVGSLELLLCHLSNKGKIDVKNVDGNDKLEKLLIKFGDGQKPPGITDVDIAVHTLERNETLISNSMESLEDAINSCVKDAKMHLSKNHRQLAKSSLRKKHELEKRLEKKAQALVNVQHLLEQIRETHTDAHVWESYKKALSAFNSTYKDTGMTEDAIDDTMILLGEVLDQHNDIQEALAKPAHDIDIDETSLEEELEDLLKSDTNNQPPDGGLNTSDLDKEFQKLALNLPDIPNSSPNTSKITEAT